MDIESTLSAFNTHLKATGYAPNSRISYTNTLNQFKTYLQRQNITSLKAVTSQTILAYHAHVMAQANTAGTKALKIRAVKRLFAYLTDTRKLLIDPTEGLVIRNRTVKKIGAVLTLKDIQTLFNRPDLTSGIQFRNRAVMEVLYSTAVRIDELLHLRVQDVDFKDNVVYIRRGKGNKDRVAPLGKHAGGCLDTYLTTIRPIHAERNPKASNLFLNRFGKPLSYMSIRGFIRQYRLAAGITKSVSPHTFRRTCATHLLQQGVDIRYIQKLLGHKNLKTTQAYTKVMPVDVKKTHTRTHPNSRRIHED